MDKEDDHSEQRHRTQKDDRKNNRKWHKMNRLLRTPLHGGGYARGLLTMTTIRYLYFPVVLFVFSCVSPWQFLHGQTASSSTSNRARAVLKAGGADSDPNIRRNVAIALSVVGRGDAVTELLTTLAKDKDALVR